MPALFDLLYREYCRAQLAEMRKQLWLTNSEVPSDVDQGTRHEAEGHFRPGAFDADGDGGGIRRP